MKKQLNKKEIIKLIKDEIKDQSSTILKLKYLL